MDLNDVNIEEGHRESTADHIRPAVVQSDYLDGAANTEHSDFDVYVVLREHNGRWSTTRTPDLDTIVMSVEDLADTSNGGSATPTAAPEC